MTDETFSAARQELQDLYISSFPDKITVLKSKLAELPQGPSSAALEELKSAVHKLAGSAGSYGFPEIANLARNIEAVIKSDDSSTVELSTLTTSLIAELEQHLS